MGIAVKMKDNKLKWYRSVERRNNDEIVKKIS